MTSQTDHAGHPPRKPEPVIIKKYANRRLYNTDTSTYVTLENLAEMVRRGMDFLVVDAKTGDDLTRPTLTQIIVEQESKGAEGGMNLLPVPFLKQLIGLYGGDMQFLVPNYLEHTMRHFGEAQKQWQALVQKGTQAAQQSATTLNQTLAQTMSQSITPALNSGANPIQALQQAGQQIGRQMFDQNRAMMEQTQKFMMNFFTPFAPPADASPRDKSDALSVMKTKVSSLEEELKGMEGE